MVWCSNFYMPVFKKSNLPVFGLARLGNTGMTVAKEEQKKLFSVDIQIYLKILTYSYKILRNC